MRTEESLKLHVCKVWSHFSIHIHRITFAIFNLVFQQFCHVMAGPGATKPPWTWSTTIPVLISVMLSGIGGLYYYRRKRKHRQTQQSKEEIPCSTPFMSRESTRSKLCASIAGSILSSWVELIGNTPMIRIQCLSQLTGCEIYVRLIVPRPHVENRIKLTFV